MSPCFCDVLPARRSTCSGWRRCSCTTATRTQVTSSHTAAARRPSARSGCGFQMSRCVRPVCRKCSRPVRTCCSMSEYASDLGHQRLGLVLMLNWHSASMLDQVRFTKSHGFQTKTPPGHDNLHASFRVWRRFFLWWKTSPRRHSLLSHADAC